MVEGGSSRNPLLAMLLVHLMQNCFGYSDQAMEEGLEKITIPRQFAGLSLEGRRLSKIQIWLLSSWLSSTAHLATVACRFAKARTSCNSDQCAELKQEKGAWARFGKPPDQEGIPKLHRQEGASALMMSPALCTT